MALTDIQISEELQTGAPSIKYRGNEGPQAPMQMASDPMLKEEYEKYVYEMQEQGREPISFEQFVQEIMSGMADGGRVPAAFGGIMDSSTGRRAYGWGSKLKGAVKSITRPIKKVFKSDVGKAALGAAALYGLNRFGLPGSKGFGKPGGGFGSGFFSKAKPWLFGTPSKGIGTLTGSGPATWASTKASTPGILGKIGLTKGAGSMMPTMLGGLTAATALPLLGIGMGKEESLDLGLNIPDSQKFDQSFSQMRKDIGDAVASGVKENFDEVLNKYGLTEGVNINFWEDIRTGSAEGGRAGFYEGGLSIPSKNTMEDVRKAAMQDRLGGITDIMKQADLYRQGDVGQMYMAEGGEIDSRNRLSELMVKLANGTITLEEKIELMHIEKDSNKAQGGRIGYAGGGGSPYGGHSPSHWNSIIEAWNDYDGPMTFSDFYNNHINKAQGGRIDKAEGGIMDLGGMEKDYRQEGGFVPIGKKEKADDVPARLSVNEFVMTADAVRGAGGGDIDKGAEIMERVMKNLEKGGRISEETQGLSGAQEMFDVSERLSEVV